MDRIRSVSETQQKQKEGWVKNWVGNKAAADETSDSSASPLMFRQFLQPCADYGTAQQPATLTKTRVRSAPCSLHPASTAVPRMSASAPWT